MAIIYERETGRISERYPGVFPGITGTMGQMSLRRLCEILEKCGEIYSNEKITHLEISGNLIRYRVEHK